MTPSIASKLNRVRFKPKGEPVEHLAFINDGEEMGLRKRGGAGLMTKFGVRSFHGGGMTQSSSTQSLNTQSNSQPQTRSAMQGGFGAQAFGRSTSSSDAVSNAVRSGMSGGVAAGGSRPTNAGTAVAGGYGAQAFGRSSTSQLPSQYQNQRWAVNGQGLSPTGVTQIRPDKMQDRIMPTAPVMVAKDQARIPNQSGYSAQPHVAVRSISPMAGQGAIPSRVADAWSRQDSMPHYQLTQVATAPQVAQIAPVADTPYTRQATATRIANPFRGVDTNSQDYVDRRNQVDAENNSSFPVAAARVAGRTPIGAGILGLGRLFDGLSGGFYGGNAGSGGMSSGHQIGESNSGNMGNDGNSDYDPFTGIRLKRKGRFAIA